MAPKRRWLGRGEDRGGGGGGGGGGSGRGGVLPQPSFSRAQALKRRCRSFDLENRGCSCCRRHQELNESSVHRLETSFAELKQEVKEMLTVNSQLKQEVKEMLTSLVKCHPDPRERIVQNRQSPSYKLIFENSMGEKLFTRREVRAADGDPIKIRIVSSSQNGSNIPRHLSTANVKIVVLDGDFNADNREVWTSEEFDDYVVRPRDKAGALLAGKLDVKLKNGEGVLPDVTFIDNSIFTRSGTFKLGVKIIDDNGEQVLEGISEPFTVKDRRGEGYKKKDIPSREDELWRLKGVRKNGTFQKALEGSGISSVEGFLRRYHKDEKALRNIHKTSPPVWTTIVEHAKKCDPGSALYSHFVEGKNIRLYFNSLGQIVGASVAEQYKAFGDLDTHGKIQVEELSKDAYECLTYQQPDYEMCNSQPRPINRTTIQGLIAPGTKSTDSIDQAMDEEQGTSSGNIFSGSGSEHPTFEGPGSLQVQTLSTVHEDNETQIQVEESSKDADECLPYPQPDYEMRNNQPRPLNLSTLQGSISLGPKSIDSTDHVMHEQQDTPNSNTFSGGHSQHSTFEGSGFVHTLPTVHEDNETGASIDIQLDSHPEILYGTPDPNCNTGLSAMDYTIAAEEIFESVAQNQGALTMHENYHMDYTSDCFSVGRWYSQQQVASLYASPFSTSIQADLPLYSRQNSFMDQQFDCIREDDSSQLFAPIVSELPADVHSGRTMLPSYRRWVRLKLLLRWKAKLRASRRAKASV